MSCTSTCKDSNFNTANITKAINISNINQEDILGLETVNYNNKIQLLLDLDSTVINSLSLDEELKYLPDEEQKHFTYIDMPKYYRIFERPYLQDFLDYAFREFDISVMTAADKDYAVFIADKILIGTKPDRKINFLFYGYHSGLSENYFDSPKDLRILWQVFKLSNFNKCNTIIIDDLPAVYKNNPYNSIPAPRFELLTNRKTANKKARYDSFLLKVITQLEAYRDHFRKYGCIN